MSELDTKSKVLLAADRLFAQKGFDGTSVRDIAGAANVNIAAINYHFKNKSALYWEVAMRSHLWLEEQIAELAQKPQSVADLTWATYEMLGEDSHRLKNAFMMFISDSTPELDESLLMEMKKHQEFGPPGGQYFFAAISREAGEALPVEGRKWAVKSIFTAMIHWALIAGTGHCQSLYRDHPDLQTDNIQKSLYHIVFATLEYLKNHPEQWALESSGD